MKNKVSPLTVILLLSAIFFGLRALPDSAINDWAAFIACSDNAICFDAARAHYASLQLVYLGFAILSIGLFVYLLKRAVVKPVANSKKR